MTTRVKNHFSLTWKELAILSGKSTEVFGFFLYIYCRVVVFFILNS